MAEQNEQTTQVYVGERRIGTVYLGDRQIYPTYEPSIEQLEAQMYTPDEVIEVDDSDLDFTQLDQEYRMMQEFDEPSNLDDQEYDSDLITLLLYLLQEDE